MCRVRLAVAAVDAERHETAYEVYKQCVASVTNLLLDYWTLCKNSYASSGGGGGDDAIAQNEMVSQGNCQVVKDFPPLSTRSSNVNSGN